MNSTPPHTQYIIMSANVNIHHTPALFVLASQISNWVVYLDLRTCSECKFNSQSYSCRFSPLMSYCNTSALLLHATYQSNVRELRVVKELDDSPRAGRTRKQDQIARVECVHNTTVWYCRYLRRRTDTPTVCVYMSKCVLV